MNVGSHTDAIDPRERPLVQERLHWVHDPFSHVPMLDRALPQPWDSHLGSAYCTFALTSFNRLDRFPCRRHYKKPSLLGRAILALGRSGALSPLYSRPSATIIQRPGTLHNDQIRQGLQEYAPRQPRALSDAAPAETPICLCLRVVNCPRFTTRVCRWRTFSEGCFGCGRI